jgi:hypothetical protein
MTEVETVSQMGDQLSFAWIFITGSPGPVFVRFYGFKNKTLFNTEN